MSDHTQRRYANTYTGRRHQSLRMYMLSLLLTVPCMLCWARWHYGSG